MHNTKVLVSFCDSYELKKIEEKIYEQVINLNVVDKIISSKSILLKPNLLAAHLPQEAVTTHPVFIQAVIRVIKKLNPNTQIILTDSPSVLNFQEVVVKTGIKEIVEKENINLININNYPIFEVEFNKFGLNKIVISKIVKEVDLIINLPKLKTHSLTVFSCAVKNLYGLVPGLTKSLYHKYAVLPQDFLEIIYTIYKEIRPQLTIVDGIVGMDKEGPSSGRIRNFNLIISSTSALAVDWFLAKKLIKKRKLPFYKDKYFETAQVIHLDEKCKNLIEKTTLELPLTITFLSFLPGFFVNILKKFIWFRPQIMTTICKRCGKCFEICPKKTIYFVKKEYKINYLNCISCFCCVETCPYRAIEIKQSLILRFTMRLKRIFRK